MRHSALAVTRKREPVEAWAWAEVTRISNRINTHIRKRLSVAKIDARAVLPMARKHLDGGLKPL